MVRDSIEISPGLARLIKSARIKSGYKHRSTAAAALEIDDSTLAILEGARQGRVSEDMVAFVTTRYGLQEDQWTRAKSADGEETVGSENQDPSELRFRRPEGMSDAEWERQQAKMAGYWEGLLDQAQTER